MSEQIPVERLRAMVKDTYPKLFPQDVDLYIAECERRAVHPLSRLIVPRPNIKKNDRTGEWERGGPPAWITTIDLMRARADETKTYAPGQATKYEYTKDGNKLLSARAYVQKLVGNQMVEFSEDAEWEEFYPGPKQGAMWDKMPRVMLSKVAEARALRRGWPAQLQGLYEAAEMDQADEPQVIQRHGIPADPPKSDSPDVSTDAKFQTVLAQACKSRGMMREATFAWMNRNVLDQNKSAIGISIDKRLMIIDAVKAGEHDADIRGCEPPKAEPFSVTAERFIDRATAPDIGLSRDEAQQSLAKWLRRIGMSQTPDNVSPEKRAELIRAQESDQFDYATGAIKAPEPVAA